MTNQEFNNEESQSQDGTTEPYSTTLIEPPSYVSAQVATATSTVPATIITPTTKENSIAEAFSHVSIPPPATQPDGNAVDIRVDDDHDLSDQHEVVQSPSDRYSFVTPYRASRDFISSVAQARCQLISFENAIPKDSRISAGRSSSISGGSSFDSSLSNAPPASAPIALGFPPLTCQDMWEALPAREAVYLADSMEWVVILPEEEVRSNGRVDVPTLPISESQYPLWTFHGSVQIPADLQKKPITTLFPAKEGIQSELGYLEDFEWWRSNKGHSLLTNKIGSLPSVVPVELMESLRVERISNPRPGQTGENQFRDSVSTLIKVVGNAANGEMRALTVTGKTITTKLGIDDISRTILEVLGFTGEGKADANGLLPMIKPPDMSQKGWQLKLRRAWLEMTLWYQYKRLKSMENDTLLPEILTSIPLAPQYISSTEFVQQCFSFDQSTQCQAPQVYVEPGVQDSCEFLGADSTAVEGLIDDCYTLNTNGLPLSEMVPYFTALQKIGKFFESTDTEIIQTRIHIEKSRGVFSLNDLQEAYFKIGLEINTTDQAREIGNDFLLSVYLSSVSQYAAKKQEVQMFKDALEIISTSRGKPKEIEDQIAFPVELTLTKAYEILGLTPDIDDEFVMSMFTVTQSDGSKSVEECTEALRVIAEERKSAILKRGYRTAIGEPEEWEEPDLEKPIGLNNIGNTCYLNSVLQYFFAIRQLRDHVMQASQGDSVQKQSKNSKIRVGGRQVSNREIERSNRFVQQLAQLFSNMISSPASAVTPERELAYLALVSSRVEEINEVAEAEPSKKSSTPAEHVASMQISNANSGTETTTSFVDEPSSISTSGSGDDKQHIAIASQSTPVQGDDVAGKDIISSPDEDGITTPPLPSLQPPPLPIRPAAEVFDAANEVGQRRNSLMQLGAQQDVGECLDNVMFQVEVALTASEQTSQGKTRDATSEEDSIENDEGWIEDGDLLRKLFLGRTLQRLELATPEDEQKGRGSSIHSKREVFTILPIDVVEEGRNIYDGLDGFFDEEILVGSKGEPIRRTVTLMNAPAIMQIQLQRVQFDRIKGAYKSQAHLEVGQTLFLDRYVDFNPLDEKDVKRLEKRRVGREARKRIEELRARSRALEPEKTPISRTLKQTNEFLASLSTTLGNVKASVKEGNSNELKELCDPGFNEFLAQEANRVDEEIKAIETEITGLKEQVEELWKEETRFEYVLASVFMHRGEASHGHYFLNQRRLTEKDREPSSIWYKYNDQSVTQVGWSEVHRDTSGATPYLLCWVRKDKLNHFDSLCRNYEAVPTQESSNTNENKNINTTINSNNTTQQDDVVMTDVTPPS